jgi:hypothetical protein
VLIDETYAFDPTTYTASSFATGYGFDGGSASVYRVDGLLSATNGLDWFEGAFARPAVVLADFVAAMHSTGDEMTYLRALDESPTVMTAANCTYEIPACGGSAFAPIESPCDRYNVCEVSVAETTTTPATTAAATTDAATTAAATTDAATTAAATTAAATTDAATTAAATTAAATTAAATTAEAEDTSDAEVASGCVGAALVIVAAAFA